VPYDVAAFVERHSERRIRIIDMIGRRGRFITLGAAGFFYLYSRQTADPSPAFALGFLQENLFDAVISGWVFLAFYYFNGFIAAAMYGPQSRVMDGVLARANCLLITTLWAAFKFIFVPIGSQLAGLFQPNEFAAVFAMIWGSYMACDAFAEIGGSIFGRQSIRVRGIGDVNRKSVAGTVSGFLASLSLCLVVVATHSLPSSWVILAIVISASNTVLELWSPRGTDDFTMATSNALICWVFGALR
jgi:dolichol kinase